jgi:hypothetical protein
MGLDAEESRLTKIGTVTVRRDGKVLVKGFIGENCTYRDLYVLAMTHAIQVLSRELMADLTRGVGGSERTATY